MSPRPQPTISNKARGCAYGCSAEEVASIPGHFPQKAAPASEKKKLNKYIGRNPTTPREQQRRWCYAFTRSARIVLETKTPTTQTHTMPGGPGVPAQQPRPRPRRRRPEASSSPRCPGGCDPLPVKGSGMGGEESQHGACKPCQGLGEGGQHVRQLGEVGGKEEKEGRK